MSLKNNSRMAEVPSSQEEEALTIDEAVAKVESGE